MRATLLLILWSLTCGPVVASAPKAEPNEWLLGYWHLISDEDGSPPDWTQFKADGTAVVISPQCTTFAGRYHVFEGNVYLTFQLAKGPIALVYVPSPDKRQLTYTSPRTRNNAKLEKVRGVPCTNVS